MSDLFGFRLYDEYQELGERIGKVKSFIASEQFDKLEKVDASDLGEQLRHMEALHRTMTKRVARQSGRSA